MQRQILGPEIEIPKRIRTVNGCVNPDNEEIWIPIHKIDWFKRDDDEDGRSTMFAVDSARYYIDAPIEDVLREVGRWLH